MGTFGYPRVRREALLDEFERCGVSAAEFATHIGVKYSTFCHWKRCRDLDRIRQTVEGEETETAVSKTVWLEAVADTQVVSVEDGLGNRPAVDLPLAALPITLPGGARLEISHRSQLPLAAGLPEMLRNGGVASC